MTSPVQTPTADCAHCRKPIRANRAGIWGARKRDDPHPWYCDADPDAGKRHEPAIAEPSREAATTECRVHGTVPDDHFPCRVPGETADQFQNRLLGYWRDV